MSSSALFGVKCIALSKLENLCCKIQTDDLKLDKEQIRTGYPFILKSDLILGHKYFEFSY